MPQKTPDFSRPVPDKNFENALDEELERFLDKELTKLLGKDPDKAWARLQSGEFGRRKTDRAELDNIFEKYRAELDAVCGKKQVDEWLTLKQDGVEYQSSLAELYRNKMGESAYQGVLYRHRQSKKGSKSSGKPPLGIAVRALICVLREDYNRNVKASTLLDQLELEKMTFDDDDIELSLDGDYIVITDLSKRDVARIKSSSLREYLKRARSRLP